MWKYLKRKSCLFSFNHFSTLYFGSIWFIQRSMETFCCLSWIYRGCTVVANTFFFLRWCESMYFFVFAHRFEFNLDEFIQRENEQKGGNSFCDYFLPKKKKTRRYRLHIGLVDISLFYVQSLICTYSTSTNTLVWVEKDGERSCELKFQHRNSLIFNWLQKAFTDSSVIFSMIQILIMKTQKTGRSSLFDKSNKNYSPNCTFTCRQNRQFNSNRIVVVRIPTLLYQFLCTFRNKSIHWTLSNTGNSIRSISFSFWINADRVRFSLIILSFFSWLSVCHQLTATISSATLNTAYYNCKTLFSVKFTSNSSWLMQSRFLFAHFGLLSVSLLRR